MEDNKKYFYGNAISDYGMANGFVDYATLAKAGDAVLCNNITSLFYGTVNGEYMEPEIYCGSDTTYYKDGEEITQEEAEALNWDDVNEELDDVYQWFIVNGRLLDALEEAGELVYYLEPLDIYIWGVKHFGTSWDYVLTSIKIDW